MTKLGRKVLYYQFPMLDVWTSKIFVLDNCITVCNLCLECCTLGVSHSNPTNCVVPLSAGFKDGGRENVTVGEHDRAQDLCASRILWSSFCSVGRERWQGTKFRLLGQLHNSESEEFNLTDFKANENHTSAYRVLKFKDLLVIVMF